jgi:hypothetical protein
MQWHRNWVSWSARLLSDHPIIADVTEMCGIGQIKDLHPPAAPLLFFFVRDDVGKARIDSYQFLCVLVSPASTVLMAVGLLGSVTSRISCA